MAADRDVEGLTFRRMQVEDLDRVVHNETRSYAFPWTRGIFADCLGSGHECWLAVRLGRKEDDIIGHGVLSVAAGEGHLLNVCVRRDQQGDGYGRALVEHMVDTARSREVGTLFLEVRPSNYIAAALYDSLGFVEVGVRKDYYPAHLGSEDARVLALDLSTLER